MPKDCAGAADHVGVAATWASVPECPRARQRLLAGVVELASEGASAAQFEIERLVMDDNFIVD